MIGPLEVITLALIAVVAFLASKLRAYAKELGKQLAIKESAGEIANLVEQGKNLATKKDIEDITHKIEAVKLEYGRQLEQTKGTLSAQLAQHGFRYRREFEMLEELCGDLVHVRKETTYLRSVYVKDSTEGVHFNTDAINKLVERILNLADKIDRYRPFIAMDVYTSINNVCHIARDEALACLEGEKPASAAAWAAAGKTTHDLLQSHMAAALESIRLRTVEWDELVH